MCYKLNVCVSPNLNSHAEILLPSVIVGSLVAQLAKNLPAMQETWVLSLDWEDSLERERLSTPVFWPGEFHGQRRLVGCSPWDRKELDTTE